MESINRHRRSCPFGKHHSVRVRGRRGFNGVDHRGELHAVYRQRHRGTRPAMVRCECGGSHVSDRKHQDCGRRHHARRRVHHRGYRSGRWISGPYILAHRADMDKPDDVFHARHAPGGAISTGRAISSDGLAATGDADVPGGVLHAYRWSTWGAVVRYSRGNRHGFLDFFIHDRGGTCDDAEGRAFHPL